MFLKSRWKTILAVAVVLAVLLGNKGFRRLFHNTRELHKLQKEYSTLIQEESTLQDQLKKAKTSDFAIEAAARRDLGFVKPGELEYRFPPPPVQPAK